jgi:hypothetical protein
VLLRRNRIALLTALVLPVAMVYSLKASGVLGAAGGSRGVGAMLLTGLTVFALLLPVYYNLVTAMVARREELVLKRLRTGEATDAEILAGTAAPAVTIAWAQVAVAAIAAVAIFGMDAPANIALMLAAQPCHRAQSATTYPRLRPSSVPPTATRQSRRHAPTAGSDRFVAGRAAGDGYRRADLVGQLGQDHPR